GVVFRSRVLGLPFGDQGLCLRREVFFELGGFNEDARYGEDHLLVWKAHQQDVPILPVKAKLQTSARRYRSEGWLPPTAKHVALTAVQATPEIFRILRAKVFR